MVVSEESPDTELRFLCLLRPGDVDEEGVGCMPARAKVGRRDRGRGPSQILREGVCDSLPGGGVLCDPTLAHCYTDDGSQISI